MMIGSLRTFRPTRLLSLLIAVILAVPSAAEEPRTITLEEAIAMAANRPDAQRALREAEIARRGATIEGRLGLLPRIGGQASYFRQDRAFEIETPLGNFPFQDKERLTLAAEITQPLLDPVQRWYTARAAQDDARAAESASLRTVHELQATAALTCLDLARLDAREESLAAFVASLEGQLERLEALVDVGRLLETDALKVRIALEEAEQGILEIRHRREVLLAELQRVTAADAPIQPDVNVSVVPASSPDRDDSIRAAIQQRPDLAALRAQLEGTQRRRDGIWMELIPTIEAKGRVITTDPPTNTLSRWHEVEIGLTWELFAAGTRPERKAIHKAEVTILEARLSEAVRGIEVEVQSVLADWQVARDGVDVWSRGVGYAQKTLDVEQARYEEGRVTINDVLDAEADLLERRTKLRLAKIDRVSAWVAWRLATGAGFDDAPSIEEGTPNE